MYQNGRYIFDGQPLPAGVKLDDRTFAVGDKVGFKRVHGGTVACVIHSVLGDRRYALRVTSRSAWRYGYNHGDVFPSSINWIVAR